MFLQPPLPLRCAQTPPFLFTPLSNALRPHLYDQNLSTTRMLFSFAAAILFLLPSVIFQVPCFCKLPNRLIPSLCSYNLVTGSVVGIYTTCYCLTDLYVYFAHTINKRPCLQQYSIVTSPLTIPTYPPLGPTAVRSLHPIFHHRHQSLLQPRPSPFVPCDSSSSTFHGCLSSSSSFSSSLPCLANTLMTRREEQNPTSLPQGSSPCSRSSHFCWPSPALTSSRPSYTL